MYHPDMFISCMSLISEKGGEYCTCGNCSIIEFISHGQRFDWSTGIERGNVLVNKFKIAYCYYIQEPLYMMVHNKMVLDMRHFKGGP